MREFLKILKRYIPPYKTNLALTFLYHFLSAIFAVFSVGMMIPILEILFGMAEDVNTMIPWAFSLDSISHNLYYFLTQFKNAHGPGLTLLGVGLLVTFGTFLKVGFAYLGAWQTVFIRNSVVRDLLQQIYARILRLALPFFTEERKGDIMSRISGDVSEVENSIMSSLDMFLKNPILILVFLISLLILSPTLTMFILVLLPFTGFIIGRIGKSLKKVSREGQDKMGLLLTIIEESLSGLRIIKAFNAENKMEKRFNGELNLYQALMNKLMWRRELAHPLSELLGTLVMVLIVWFGGTLILSKNSELSGATFIAYLAIFYQIINPAKAFTSALYSIQKGLASMDRIDKILLADVTIREKPDALPFKALTQTIEYRNVNFAYSDKEVLRNISLKVSRGSTVALVGQSGSGKTTFVDLLPRFYDVTGGQILIDGIDIRDLKLHDLRNLMGNVNQEAILFNDTIYNNSQDRQCP